MNKSVGKLVDGHKLSEKARRYANEVLTEDSWPLSETDVELFDVVFRTTMSARREHAVTEYDPQTGSCTIVISEKTAALADFSAVERAIRHELVHLYQFQTVGTADHGPTFDEWADQLELDGPCSRYRDTEGNDYRYRITCENCGFITGRYELDKTVRSSVRQSAYCDTCRGDVHVIADEGRLRERDIES